MNLLLDTCAIIWLAGATDKLSARAREVLEDPDTVNFFSPASCSEVACAVQRSRLKLQQHWKPWFRHQVELNGWTEVPIDLAVVEEAYSLPDPFHADPVDRILVATARLHRLTILTGDRKLRDYPHVKTLW